jgi:hypothetical protein
VTISHSTRTVALGLALTCSLLIVGCGTGSNRKTDDPVKVEEQMKEYRDMSHKERSG